MKLRLLGFLGMLACTFAGVQAQTSSNDVVFVNAKGDAIAPDATLNVNKVEDDVFTPGQKQMHAELSISNRSGKSQKVKLSYNIEMQEGLLEVCAFESCNSHEEAGTYQLESKDMAAAGREELSIKHTFATKGSGKIVLQIIIMEDEGNGKMTEKNGPKFTVNFMPETAGIASSPIPAGGIYDVYDTNGVLRYQKLTSLSTLPKGTYIVKYRDGQGTISTKKYVIS
ncbi:T9SS type A sorting domain-containing protein [Hoylesella timonensis]|uniref:T9SS type A sorting domain-containing protein n=1 Tax=Hoylesella timonensis TaxID=386414 RepID=UPI00336A21DD